MIRTLRALFLGRLLREKLLLVAFVLLGVLIWLSGFSRRTAQLWREQSATTAALTEQKQWLVNRPQIEADAQKAAARLDAARTLDATRLYAEVEQLVREFNLTYGMGEQQNEIGGQFAVHSLQVTITKAKWDDLRQFYLKLQARSPYIGIERFALNADRANPALLSASLRVSSVEISK